jgi:purine nucleosidase
VADSIKVHLDTDLGGDIDDLCALALLLSWPGVEITGITVVGDDRGRRTGYTRYVLKTAGREDIPVAAGADVADGYYPYPLGLPPEERYWPEPVSPSPNPPEEAVALLKGSIEQGAAVIGIGPYTNLALLEKMHPGILAQTHLFLMGGFLYPTRPGYPQWGNDMDFNIQVDVKSAQYVIEHARPTFIPLTVTVETALRRAYLEPLRQSNALGRLIARQAEAFAIDEQMETRFGKACPALPADIINFQHDPLACAVVLGWQDGIEIVDQPLIVEEKDGLLYERVHPGGRLMRIVTAVDGPRFNEFWLNRVKGDF